MQTTQSHAVDLQAAVKKTLTSTAFSKLVAQAVQEALSEAAQAQADTITLPSQLLGQVRFVESEEYRFYTAISADSSCEVHMQCDRAPDQAKHRGTWYGNETRTNASGEKWFKSIPRMVQNDFGFLVEVSA